MAKKAQIEGVTFSFFQSWSTQPKHIVALLKGLIWGMFCLPCSVMP